MNSEHYAKVKRVLAESQAILNRLGTRMEAVEALVEAESPCQRVWEREFSENSGVGRTVPLDLGDAELTGGLFVLEWFGKPNLNRTNFRKARLRNTFWATADATSADFEGADLRDSKIIGFHCPGASFRSADLSGALIWITIGENDKPADLTNANLTRAQIIIEDRVTVILQEANMRECLIKANRPDHPAQVHARESLIASLTDVQRSQMRRNIQ